MDMIKDVATVTPANAPVQAPTITEVNKADFGDDQYLVFPEI